MITIDDLIKHYENCEKFWGGQYYKEPKNSDVEDLIKQTLDFTRDVLGELRCIKKGYVKLIK